MVCLGLEPVQTNPLSYGGTPMKYKCLIEWMDARTYLTEINFTYRV